MKYGKLVLGINLLVVAMAFNAEARSSRLECPAGSRTALVCTDATQAGDYEVAISYMDEAIVCEKGTRSAMWLDGDAMQQPMGPIPVRKMIRTGATSYSVSRNGVDFVLSRAMTGPNTRINGRFTITVQGTSSYRSLICQ